MFKVSFISLGRWWFVDSSFMIRSSWRVDGNNVPCREVRKFYSIDEKQKKSYYIFSWILYGLHVVRFSQLIFSCLNFIRIHLLVAVIRRLFYCFVFIINLNINKIMWFYFVYYCFYNNLFYTHINHKVKKNILLYNTIIYIINKIKYIKII